MSPVHLRLLARRRLEAPHTATVFADSRCGLCQSVRIVYVSVEPFHLFRYLDEQSFRFNNRGLNDSERFNLVVGGIAGKRLAWDRLTGKEELSSSSPLAA